MYLKSLESKTKYNFSVRMGERYVFKKFRITRI